MCESRSGNTFDTTKEDERRVAMIELGSVTEDLILHGIGTSPSKAHCSK